MEAMQPIMTRYEVNSSQIIWLALKKCSAAQYLCIIYCHISGTCLLYSAVALKAKNPWVTFCSYCIFMKQIQLNDTFAISNTKVHLGPTGVCVMSAK